MLSGCTKSDKNSVSLNIVPDNTESTSTNKTTQDNRGSTTEHTLFLEDVNDQNIVNENIINDIIIEDFFLIHNGINKNIFPNDFLIGQIQDTISIGYNASLVYNIVVDFCNSLIDKILDDSKIYELKKELILSSISYYLNSTNQIEHFRIGEITIKSNTMSSANVRFFSDYGSINGQIYLIKSDNMWNISDLQFNFMDFTSKDNNKFSPGYYNIDVYGLTP